MRVYGKAQAVVGRKMPVAMWDNGPQIIKKKNYIQEQFIKYIFESWDYLLQNLDYSIAHYSFVAHNNCLCETSMN